MDGKEKSKVSNPSGLLTFNSFFLDSASLFRVLLGSMLDILLRLSLVLIQNLRNEFVSEK